MKRLFPIATMSAIVTLILVTATAMAAKTVSPDVFLPKKPYKADFTASFQQSGQSMNMKGKIWATKTKERREMVNMGRKVIFIKDRRTEKQYTLMPERRMYTVSGGISKEERDPVDMIQDGDATVRRIGTDFVNNRKVIKYEIKSKEQGREAFHGFAYMTPNNIPVRYTGTAMDRGMKSTFTMNFTGIVVGRLKSSLFTVPVDWKEIPTGFGRAPKGYGSAPDRHRKKRPPTRNPNPGTTNPMQRMTPEQIEQMTRNMTPEQREKFMKMMESFRGQQGTN